MTDIVVRFRGSQPTEADWLGGRLVIPGDAVLTTTEALPADWSESGLWVEVETP